jgi:hypothetical protein
MKMYFRFFAHREHNSLYIYIYIYLKEIVEQNGALALYPVQFSSKPYGFGVIK